MSRTQVGLIYCVSFVTLESFQAVFLGSVFQDVDSFLIGAWVFGLSFVVCTVATAIWRPQELIASRRAWRIVFALNVLASTTWSSYFVAVQLIEPAVVFTVFSGMVPLGTVLGAWLGIREAFAQKRWLSRVGNLTMLISLLYLGAITILGFSGFVRGGATAAFWGVTLSAVSGACTAFVILFSVRLNQRGVGPLAQFGLRFVLYSILAYFAFRLGLDSKAIPVPVAELSVIVLVGLCVIAFPLYLVQKAVPLVSATTIAAMTALGPSLVFLMQFFDGRVAYSSATLMGLLIYMAGALLSAYGAAARDALRT